MKKLIGEILISEGYITEEKLTEGLEKQKTDGRLLGIILIEMGHITQKELEKAMIKQKQYIIDDSKSMVESLNSIQQPEMVQ